MARSKPPPDSDLKTLKHSMSDVFYPSYKKGFSILITGKFGSGKSSLVNTLVGRPAAEEDDCYKEKADTSETKQYSVEVMNGAKVQIWDSPGLQDGTDNDDLYLAHIQKKLKGEVDLVIYCLKMDDRRFDQADKISIKKLHETFGKELWEHTVVALTFADKVEPTKFMEELKLWQENIHTFFKNELNIGPELLQSMPIVPTGYYKQPPSPSQHPNQSEWRTKFWCACYNVSRISGACELVKLRGKDICNLGPSPDLTKDGENIMMDDEDEETFWNNTWAVIKANCPGPVRSIIARLMTNLGYTE